MPTRLILFFSFFSFNAFAQSDTIPKLGVFIDCNGIACDDVYMKSEIRIVDFLIVRNDADVHLLIRSITTVGNAEQYKLIFYGQKKYQMYNDTLTFVTKQDNTHAEKREQLVHYIKAGLIPLLNKAGFVDAFSVEMSKSKTALAEPSNDDKWNYFVFNIGFDGEYSADQNYTNARLRQNLSVNRITEKTRFGLGGFSSKYYSVYNFEDSSGITKFEVNNNDFGIYQYSVFSLGQHWSAGYVGRFTGNTFTNTNKNVYFSPLLEFNIFKYKDVYTRSFVIRYGPDFTYFEYNDTTIYDKNREQFFGHEVSANINFNQKWGSFNSSLYYREYFSGGNFNSMGANVSFSIRLFSGFSFYVLATGSIIHDQVYLPKGGATQQEILIRRRQLASNFYYFTSSGLYYTFGSKLSNVVNPRITGDRGF